MILIQRRYNMIEGACVYIGKIIGMVAISKNLNGAFIYFIRTPYKGVKYMKTEKALKEGELVFYIEVSDNNDNTNKVFFYEQFENVKIVEVNNYYLDWNNEDIPTDTDFCIIKPTWKNKYKLFYNFKEKTFTLNNKRYSNRTPTELYGRDNDLVRFVIERGKLKSSYSIVDAFYNPIKYEDIRIAEKEITSKVESLDIAGIIKSYTIKHERFYDTRVGRDDYCEECFMSDCIKTDINLPPNILPAYTDVFWEKSGYPAHYAPQELYLEHRQLAEQKEKEIKQFAFENYNKAEHIQILLNEYLKKLVFKALNPHKMIDYVKLETRVYEDRGYINGMIDNDNTDNLIIYSNYNEEQVNEYCNKYNTKEGIHTD